MGKRLFASAVLCLITIACVFATVTVDYHFEIKGMMLEFVLREKTGIPKTAEYDSMEAVDASVSDYRSKLNNLRCFTKVEPAVSFDESGSRAEVVYYLEVAKSSLALPYPKYDSNSGISIKLKYVNDNFFGTFGKIDFTGLMISGNSDNFNATWQKYANYQTTLKVSDVIVNEARISGDLDSKLYFGYLRNSADAFKCNSYIKGSLSIDNVKFGNNVEMDSIINFNTGAKELDKIDEIKNSFNFGVSTKIGDLYFRPTLSLTDIPYKRVESEWVFYNILSFGFSGIKIGNSDISLTPSVRIDHKSNDWKYGNIRYYRNETRFSLDKFVLNNDTYFYYPNKSNELYSSRYVNTSTIVKYEFSPVVRPTLSVVLNLNPENNSKTYIELTELIETRFEVNSLPFDFSFGLMERPYYFTNNFNFGFTGSLSTSIDKLNYTNGEFRKGLKFNWVADAKFSPVSEFFNVDKTCKSYVRTRAQLTWFPVEWGWFNPSIRVTGTLSNIPFGDYTKKFEGASSSYFVSDDIIGDKGKGYGIDYTNTSENILLGEYLRGIRDANDDAMSISDTNAAFVINMNATARFIKLGDFADTYVNPFMDLAVIVKSPMDSTKREIKKFATVGLEGIGVMKSHPSYPIRASLGFNVNGLKNFIKNPSKTNLPEYELYIGLYHFFEVKH